MATGKNQPNAAPEEPSQQEIRRTRFVKELIGIFLGISLAMMISSVVPAIREQYSLGMVVLWGGAIGGLLTSYERFERAGAALTRSENRLLNYLVGIAVPLAVLAAFYFLNR